MLSSNEKYELTLSALTSDEGKSNDVKKYRKLYEMMRDSVLDESVMDIDSYSKLYKMMRNADLVYTDYIRALEDRVAFLEKFALDLTSGVVERDAEFIKNLTNN